MLVSMDMEAVLAIGHEVLWPTMGGIQSVADTGWVLEKLEYMQPRVIRRWRRSLILRRRKAFKRKEL